MNKKMFGLMIDVSRNAVIKVNQLKKLIDLMSSMGYNSLELYFEDTYKVKEYPQFGYLRGGYSKEEIKEIDQYCMSKNIELIPCIQTLAHFTTFSKMPEFKDIGDIDDILLVDDDKTYQFIDCLFKSISESFTSRKINIGMDEAHNIGLGNHLQKFGYEKKLPILLRHLNKVIEIAKNYNFECHMWSDMFIRPLNNGEYYVEDESQIEIDSNLVSKIPNNVKLIYWDYSALSEKHLDANMNIHKKMCPEFYFAGGFLSYAGFSPNNSFSLLAAEAAIKAVKKHNIENIIFTMWGDDGKECSFFNMLPCIFATSEFYKGNFNLEDIKAKFHNLLGLNFDDFMLLEAANRTRTSKDSNWNILNRVPIYNDPFLGYANKLLEKRKPIDHLNIAKQLDNAALRNKDFGYLFELQADLLRFSFYKYDLSTNIRACYLKKDNKGLENCIVQIDNAVNALDKFKESFYKLWLIENKGHGLEIQNYRLGGQKERLLFAKNRLISYLNNDVKNIEELEDLLLDDEVMSEWPPINFSSIISTNKI